MMYMLICLIKTLQGKPSGTKLHEGKKGTQNIFLPSIMALLNCLIKVLPRKSNWKKPLMKEKKKYNKKTFNEGKKKVQSMYICLCYNTSCMFGH